MNGEIASVIPVIIGLQSYRLLFLEYGMFSLSVESVNLKEDRNTLDNIIRNMRKESQRGF